MGFSIAFSLTRVTVVGDELELRSLNRARKAFAFSEAWKGGEGMEGAAEHRGTAPKCCEWETVKAEKTPLCSAAAPCWT